MARIYLDHAATSPMDPDILDLMTQTLREGALNPSSPHAEGRRARLLLREAREGIGQALGLADVRQVVFTRGGTEANHLVVWGRASRMPSSPLAFSSLEHSSVRAAMEARGLQGQTVHEIPVAMDGTLDPARWKPLLAGGSAPPALVSVQAVNSETGIVLQLEDLLEGASECHVPVHVDAVQALGRIPVPLPQGRPSDPAYVTLSSHKLGGPSGIGVLLRNPDTPLEPALFGGGQEYGLRPGTEDIAGALGAALAVRKAMAGAHTEGPRLAQLRNRLAEGLLRAVPALRLIGPDEVTSGSRAPHILMLAAPGLPRDLLPGVLDLEGIAVSAGSACRSGAASPSPAILSLYGEEARHLAPLRFSLGTMTTEHDIDEAILRTTRALARIPALQGALA